MKKNTLENQQSNDTWCGCPVGVFLTGALVLTTIFSAVVLRTNLVSADDVIDDVSITIPVSCSMSGNIDTAHTASMQPGSYSAATGSDYENGIGKTTLTTFCNDQNGFSIYAIGYTGDTDGDNTLVGTATSSYATIATGTNTSGGTSNWAMKVNKVENPAGGSPVTYNPENMTIVNSFNNYHAVPSDYMKVAEYHAQSGSSATDMGPTALGAKITTTYAAFISATQAADTYTGQVKYVMVHPYNAAAPMAPLPETACPANNICYAPNASDIVGSMSSLGAVSGYPTAGKTISAGITPTLIAPNYSRPGYGFAGWSTDFTATTSSTIYGPNETLENNDTTKGLILYPVWIASAGNLQDTTKVAELCGTGSGSLTQATYNSTTGKMEATLSSMSALTDQRDGNVYTIAKLADGKCWMTENLRIEADNTIGDTNKNLSQGYGTSSTYGNFTGLATSENANFTETTTANSLYSTDGSTANTIKGGNSSYYGYRFPRYNNNNTNRNLNPSYNGTGSGTYYQWHSYGNYYTWAAAMASVKEYTSPTSIDDEGKTSETANTSLCPAGWRLPYGNNTGNGATAGGFSYLDTRMGGTGTDQTSTAGTAQSKKWRSFPNNFVYSGYFNTASALGRGTYGVYWSSTAGSRGSSDNSYTLLLSSTRLTPGTYNFSKLFGQSIRCISNS